MWMEKLSLNVSKNTFQGRSPLWSPDEDELFTSERPSGENWVVNEEIFTMNIDGRSQQNITNNANSDSDPAWSPDGSHISFVSDHGSDGISIYTQYSRMAVPYRKPTSNLTEDYYNYRFFYSWSPDGKSIAVFHPPW